MLLAIDIGNTNLVVGLYKDDRLNDHFRIATRHNMTADEAGFYVTHWLQSMRIPNEQIDNFQKIFWLFPYHHLTSDKAANHN